MLFWQINPLLDKEIEEKKEEENFTQTSNEIDQCVLWLGYRQGMITKRQIKQVVVVEWILKHIY